MKPKLVHIIFFSIITFALSQTKTVDTLNLKKPNILNQKNKITKDVFIDKDKDGICDKRQNCIGIEKKRCKHRYGQVWNNNKKQ